jgi:hypothetical protein
MAGEYLPPRSIPMLDKEGRTTPVWYEFFRGLYLKTGAATNNATELVVAQAATADTATTATAVPATVSAGTPVGTVDAVAGEYYVDETTGTTYYNQTGGKDGWAAL